MQNKKFAKPDGQNKHPTKGTAGRIRFFIHSQNKNKTNRIIFAAMLSTLSLIIAAAPRQPPSSSKSFIYCEGNNNSVVFAGKINADQTLSFGLSVWSSIGRNDSLFDTANFAGGAWSVRQQSALSDEKLKCMVNFRYNPDKSWDVWVSPPSECDKRVQNDTLIYRLHFPAAAYRGPVTVQLNDAEAFQQANVCDADSK